MLVTRCRVFALAIFTLGTAASSARAEEEPSPPRAATYQIEHSLTVSEFPPDAGKVRIWFWLPDDDGCQKLLDLAVAEAPAGYQITRDAASGHLYLYAEVDKPTAPIRLQTDFTVRRVSEHVALVPEEAGELTDVHRTQFAEYLRRDCPNMEVDESIETLAQEVCGDETNVVRQARALFDYVIDHSEHYSKGATAPKSSGLGSCLYCLSAGGGGCTDQHALFIALARARGIPTRLRFGSRLKPADEGKPGDPGYRCWVQYFVPRYGWVSMDIAAADTNPDQRDFFFSGLDERRVWFSDGRDLDLTPRQDGPRVNLFIVAYVEVDGQPFAGFKRTLQFTETHEPAAGQ